MDCEGFDIQRTNGRLARLSTCLARVRIYPWDGSNAAVGGATKIRASVNYAFGSSEFLEKPGCQAESCPNPAAQNPPRPRLARPAHVAASTHPEPAQTPPRSLWEPPSSPSSPAAPPSTPARQGACWRAPSRSALTRPAEQARARRRTIRPSRPPRHPWPRARMSSEDFCSTRHRAGTWPRHVGAGQESPRIFPGHVFDLFLH